MLALIIDDDSQTLELTARFFRQERISVIRASSAAEALHAVKTHPEIGIIVTDVDLPGMKGLSFLQDIKAMRDLPAVLITSNSQSAELRSEAQRLGVFAWIPKPIDEFAMCQLVQKLLRRG